MAGIDRSPYDCEIDGRGFLLAEEVAPTGQYTGKRLWTQQRVKFTPGTQPSPAAEPYTIEPELEIAQVCSVWRNGVGQREQPDLVTKDANGIFYGRYLDKCGIYLGPSAAVTPPGGVGFTPATTDAVNGGNQFIEFPLALPAPSAPTVNHVNTGGTVADGTYNVKITYVNANGETLASSLTGVTTAGGGTSTVTIVSPAASSGAPLSLATGWYAYVTQAGPGATYTRQQTAGSPTAIGANLILTAPPTSTGVSTPTTDSSFTRVLFCAMGRYLLERVSDVSWTVAKDFGAGMKITSLAKFQGQQTSQFMFIAYQDTDHNPQIYTVWDGTTFTADTNSHKAVDFVTFHEEIWLLNQDASNGNRWQVQKATDGGTGTTWGGGFAIADATQVCKHMVISQDRLFIRSTLGLLGVNSAETEAQQITGDSFKVQFQGLNECRPISFGQFAIMQTSSSFFTYDAQSGNINEIGLGVLKNNDSGIATGVHTTAAPYRFWTVYTWTWNPQNNTAYLWRWGEHELIDTLYSPVPFGEFLPCLYGSLYEQAAQVNGSLVSEIGGTTPRLYWCDAIGNISFMPLSRFTANPYSDPAVPANTTNTFEVYLPGFTARNSSEMKAATGITVVGKSFNASNFYTASYRTDPAGVFGGSSNLDNGGQYQSPVASRNNTISPVTGNWLDVKISGTNSSTSAPPLLKAAIVYQVIRPIFKWTYKAVVRLGRNVHSNSGASRGNMFGVADDRSFLESIAGAQGMVNIMTPDGSTIAVFVTDVIFEYQRREPDPNGNTKPEWFATISMVEHRPRTLHGRYSRLNPYIYSYLQQYTYAELQNL